MDTPFSTENFFLVIEDYNQWIFPFQILIFILGILCAGLLFFKKSYKNKIIGSLLGFFWIWTGLIYHIALFTNISHLAYAFGGVFILQGFFIINETFNDNKLIYALKLKNRHILGYVLIAYSLIFYPLVSYFIQGSASNIESLGLPCPTTIFTFGFFMLTSVRFPRYLLIIPSVWALIGLITAINFRIYEDFIIILVAFLAVMAKGKSRLLPGPF
jgi:hypothetical protein